MRTLQIILPKSLGAGGVWQWSERRGAGGAGVLEGAWRPAAKAKVISILCA